jgi:hypothetical protein
MQEQRYQPQYIGFYWTLPVQWAGFTRLSVNIDEATTQSRTIRYQRELAKRHVSANNGSLIDEIAFLEVDSNHGSDYIKEAIRQAEQSCRKYKAKLLWVDFHKRNGWRRHIIMCDYLRQCKVPNEPLWPETLIVGEEHFDPVKHFREWKLLHTMKAEFRRTQIDFGLGAALESVPAGYGRNRKIAEFLNEKGILTPTGRQWTPDNVIKAVRDFTTKPKGLSTEE